MVSTLLVCAGLLAVSPAGPTATPQDLAAYEEARSRVGRDADAHVKLALWCEAHGLQAERLKHLAIAVVTDPKNSAARGLMGLVAYRGQWQRPEAVPDKIRADADLSAALGEYNTRRAGMPDTAAAHWRLALWCEEQGLKAEAIAHLTAVVRLDPSREAAWKRLGCKKVNGRWVTEAQLKAQAAEAEAQAEANKHWRPLLAKWGNWLKERAKRAEAGRLLSEVSDPRAVPAVVAAFAAGHQELAVQLLGQIDAPASSRALAMLALSSRSADVRRAATETLKRRDPREYASLLIALLRDPIKYEVRPVGGPGSPGALFVQGERFNVQRLYSPPAPWVPVFPGDYVDYDVYGSPILHRLSTQKWSTGRITGQQLLGQIAQSGETTPSMNNPAFLSQMASHPADAASLIRQAQSQARHPVSIPNSLAGSLSQAIHQVEKTEHKAPSQFGFGLDYTQTTDTQIPLAPIILEAQKTAAMAEVQLESDVATVNSYNAGVREGNAQVAEILNETTGQALGADRKAWHRWWVDQLGYSYKTPEEPTVPTYVEDVPLAYQPQVQVIPTTVVSGQISGFSRMSCFGAGTQVRTIRGPQPIESLLVGDRVLTQYLKTGALEYQPILVVHHNPPSPTFLIKMADEGETIVSSPFHRFWKASKGWVMARDLKPGDTLRMLDGPARVESVESGPVQPVFNLDVAEDHDFFAGRRGALVHDNTLPELRMAPFDAEPSLAALARSRK